MELRWIILGVVLLVCGAIAVEAWVRRGRRRRRFAEMRPGTAQTRPDGEAELGMEATDTRLVDEAHKRNQIIEGRNDTIIRR
ncbi:hypothetical protein [Aliiroseovarius sp.]|uniref:hypothetical protein n=1 Tax=Aliiroseovarius sp. TaxID=1872442 RepID=UPI00261D3BDE|nr:hypothetical protein [Aliiroseovarius sp.]